MNYRHAYHAGNFADVVKHVVLCDVIAYLQRKPKPIRIIDTHAGIGAYDLTGPEASKTGEWRAGFGAVCDAVRVGARPVPAPVRAYLEAVSAALEVNSLRGSVQTPSEALSQDPSGKDPSRLSADRYAGSALLAAGLPAGVETPAHASITDVTPLCMQALGEQLYAAAEAFARKDPTDDVSLFCLEYLP